MQAQVHLLSSLRKGPLVRMADSPVLGGVSPTLPSGRAPLGRLQVHGGCGKCQRPPRRAGQDPLLPPSTQPRRRGSCTWCPSWGGEPHSGNDSPGIARLPTCVHTAPGAGIRTPTDPWRVILRPGLPLERRGVLHPQTRRVKPGNVTIFTMPPETFFLVSQGRGRRRRREGAGKGAWAEDQLPPRFHSSGALEES